MTRIMIPIDENLKRALIQYAEKQYRDPRLQAALFIRRGLENVGEIPKDNKEANGERNASDPKVA